MKSIYLPNKVVIEVTDAKSLVILSTGEIVVGTPQYDEDQAKTAQQLGYADDVESMVEDHDPLHAIIAGLFGVDSYALKVAAGTFVDNEENNKILYLEEDAVLAVQKYMKALGKSIRDVNLE